MTKLAQDNEPLLEEATSLLKALSHPARLIICCELRDQELSVGEIETTLGIRQPRLSRELSKLRDEGLVDTRRQSKLIYYTLSRKPRVRAMVDAVCAVMLDQPISFEPNTDPAPRFKPNRAGGYGVFARTEPPTNS